MTSIRDWAESYLRHRDLFEKKIAKIEENGTELKITRKDNSVLSCIAVEALDEEVLNRIKEKSILVTRNKKENLDFLVKHWEKFIPITNLRIVFANVQLNEKWVLVPHSHARIADEESLALGLQAMFESVPEG